MPRLLAFLPALVVLAACDSGIDERPLGTFDGSLRDDVALTTDNFSGNAFFTFRSDTLVFVLTPETLSELDGDTGRALLVALPGGRPRPGVYEVDPVGGGLSGLYLDFQGGEVVQALEATGGRLQLDVSPEASSASEAAGTLDVTLRDVRRDRTGAVAAAFRARYVRPDELLPVF